MWWPFQFSDAMFFVSFPRPDFIPPPRSPGPRPAVRSVYVLVDISLIPMLDWLSITFLSR